VDDAHLLVRQPMPITVAHVRRTVLFARNLDAGQPRLGVSALGALGSEQAAAFRFFAREDLLAELVHA
jgi:hypothetical protein